MQRLTLDEYESLVDELVQSIRAEMLPYTRSLYLFGSYERELEQSGHIIPGISDVDLLWIIDLTGVAHSDSDLMDHYQVIIDLVNQLILNPLYSTLLDLTILENRQLPTRIGMEFDPLLLQSASQGKVLVGRPILDDLHFSEQYLKRSAVSRFYRLHEIFQDLFIYNSFQLSDLVDDLVMTLLNIGQTMLAVRGFFNVVKKDVPEQFCNIFGGAIPSAFILEDALRIRMGVRDVNIKTFVGKAIVFVQQCFEFIQSPVL